MLKGSALAAPPGIGPVGASVAAAFAEESIAGLKLAVWGRSLALAAIALLLPFIAPYPDLIFYLGLLLLFVLLGAVQYRVSQDLTGSGPYLYLLLCADFIILSFGLLYPNPLGDTTELADEFLHGSNFKFFYVFLTLLALSYNPKLVLVGGLVGAASWIVGVVWLNHAIEGAIAAGEIVAPFSSPPESLDADYLVRTEWFESRVEEAVIFVLAAALISVAVQRSRRLLIRQVNLTRERNNLARYFPSSMVESLARSDSAFDKGREIVASVLFADVVGFTKWAETRNSDEIVAFLRDVHARFENMVFEHHGTLNKFIGDGVMATFGTPEMGPADAANALRCALRMLDDFNRWDEERRAAGKNGIRVSIGLHSGPVVIGDIGSRRHMELAVLGDTVNLASRLESMTRDLGCQLAVSEATVEAARKALPLDQASAAKLERYGPVEVRGRDRGIVIWTR